MIISGSIAISTDPQVITFPGSLQMPAATFIISYRYYDSTGQTLGGYIVTSPDSRTVTGFTFAVDGLTGGTLEYSATEVGVAIGYVSPAARLSRDWTAQEWYAELVRDMNLTVKDALYGERFKIINRAIPEAAKKYSSILGNSFMTSQSISDTAVSEVITSNLRMQMGGPEARFVVESTLTNYVDMVDFDTYKGFRSTSFQERNHIIWTKVGDSLLFKTSLANFGVRSFRFSRVPEECTTNAHMIDFPDLHMAATWIEGRKIMATRYRDIVGDIKIEESTVEPAIKSAKTTAELESPEALQKAL